MYGAGNIGRGFIGQLLSQSGYEVVFLDIDDRVIDTLNADKKYTITTVSNDKTEQIQVKNIRAINPSVDEISAIKEIAQCELMATAVGANILKYIAPVIAKGLVLRAKENGRALNILLCENLLDVNTYMKELLAKELGDSDKNILCNVGFVETSIGRMVPVMAGNNYPTDITVEEFEILHTDKAGFIGKIPKIKNMIAYAPFEAYVQRKLFMHNMGHAVTAYLGFIKGIANISEAINDIEIRYCVMECGLESAMAIAANGFPLDQLISFYNRLIYRFGNEKLKDTTFRVGRDTPRKLDFNDRITGAINLCKKNKIPYAYLLIGIASALLFNEPHDPLSAKVYKDASVNLRDTIIKYTKMTDSDDHEAIAVLYELLSKKDIKAAIRFCDHLKAGKIVDN